MDTLRPKISYQFRGDFQRILIRKFPGMSHSAPFFKLVSWVNRKGMGSSVLTVFVLDKKSFKNCLGLKIQTEAWRTERIITSGNTQN